MYGRTDGPFKRAYRLMFMVVGRAGENNTHHTTNKRFFFYRNVSVSVVVGCGGAVVDLTRTC